MIVMIIIVTINLLDIECVYASLFACVQVGKTP